MIVQLPMPLMQHKRVLILMGNVRMHVAKYSRADRELDDPNNLGHLYQSLGYMGLQVSKKPGL